MKLTIEGMSCGGCGKSVTKAIQSIDPAAKVDIKLEAREATVETTATLASVLNILEEAGYPAIPSAAPGRA